MKELPNKDISIKNRIELHHLTILNHHVKKKFKIKEGVLEKTLLKIIR